MSLPLITLDELKTHLGISGTTDDLLLAAAASNASALAERETGRTFAVASNTTRVYSTDGQASLVIHDRPMDDSTRIVRWNGTDLTEGQGYWLLPDRRNPDVSTTIQLRVYDTSRPDWYKVDPNWFDRNLDTRRWTNGLPNDLLIIGVVGHPSLTPDARLGITELAAYLYWSAKAGASGFVQTPQGDQVELGGYPESYQRFVRDWRIRTAVAAP